MFEILGIFDSGKIIVYILLAFAFFVGILLIVSKEGFRNFNSALDQEYGMKKRVAPIIENTRTDLIDAIILRYRLYAGLVITIVSFVLLIISR